MGTHFGSFKLFYDSLGGGFIVIVMLWLFVGPLFSSKLTLEEWLSSGNSKTE